MSKLTPPVDEHDHIQGNPAATLTLVEYGDYECPHCGRAYPIVKEIQKEMGEKLRFVFRNFPLGEMHPHAQHAAEAAEASGEKFWEMHDLLFEYQTRLDDAHLLRLAAKAGLDPQALAKALEDGTFRERVRKDFMSGVRSGVNGTPTFFINGVRYDGSWDLPDLLHALRRSVQ